MKSYVGMDVHSKSSVFVTENEQGEELGRGEVPTPVEGFSSLRKRFRLRASTLVALESGTMAFFAARRLPELSCQRLGTPRAWQRLMQALTPHPQVGSFVELHYRAFERLKAVPGVGEIVALTAIAVFSDATRFPSAKHAAGYAGLVPQTYQSGETKRQGHIPRTGSPELRAMLVRAAHTPRRPSSPLNPFQRNLTLRVGTRRAVIAVAHRLSGVLYAMLRDKASFEASKLRAQEPRTTAQAARIYRLIPQAAKSR